MLDSFILRDVLRGLQREAAGEHARAAGTRSARRASAGRGSTPASRAASGAGAARTRAPAVSTLKRSSSRARKPSTPSSGTRAAASSMASGMPSSRWQISTIAGAFPGVSANRGSTPCARATNSSTAPPHARRARRRHRERADAIDVLVGDLQRLLARDEHAHPGAAAARRFDECGDVVGQVLAVVEHQQQALRGEHGGHRVDRRAIGGKLRPEYAGHGRRYECTIARAARAPPTRRRREGRPRARRRPRPRPPAPAASCRCRRRPRSSRRRDAQATP